MLLDRYLDADKKVEQALHTLQERPIRSLAKAVSWRVTGTIDTIILSWLFTGNIGTALSIGFTEVATKMVLYYVHERVWNRISLGRATPNPQPQAAPVFQTNTV